MWWETTLIIKLFWNLRQKCEVVNNQIMLIFFFSFLKSFFFNWNINCVLGNGIVYNWHLNLPTERSCFRYTMYNTRKVLLTNHFNTLYSIFNPNYLSLNVWWSIIERKFYVENLIVKIFANREYLLVWVSYTGTLFLELLIKFAKQCTFLHSLAVVNKIPNVWASSD